MIITAVWLILAILFFLVLCIIAGNLTRIAKAAESGTIGVSINIDGQKLVDGIMRDRKLSHNAH